MPTAAAKIKIMTAETKPWVLILDDDVDNRELLAEFLEVTGYQALPCGTATGASAILQARSPPCLVITDVHMPALDGRTFVAELRARPGYAEVPVIFVTGADAGTLGQVREPVLTKPVDLDALMALVDRHCGIAGSPRACS